MNDEQCYTTLSPVNKDITFEVLLLLANIDDLIAMLPKDKEYLHDTLVIAKYLIAETLPNG